MVNSLDGTTTVTEDQIEELLSCMTHLRKWSQGPKTEKQIDKYKQHKYAVKQMLYGSISNHCLIEIKNLTTSTKA